MSCNVPSSRRHEEEDCPGLHLKERLLGGLFLCASAVLWCAGEKVRRPSEAALMSHVIRVVLCSDVLQHI